MKENNPIILIVDDHPDNLSILYDVLDAKKYDVRIARNGQSALEIIKKEQPDIILLDVVMPGMNGFEVCSRLKAQKETKRIPIIFMTALTETVNKVRGFELGAFDYITKPFQVEVVLAQIRNCLRLVAKEREYEAIKQTIQESSRTDLQTPIYMISSTVKYIRRLVSDVSRDELQNYLGIINSALKQLQKNTAKNNQSLNAINIKTKIEPATVKTDVNLVEFCKTIAETFNSGSENSENIAVTSSSHECRMKIDTAIMGRALSDMLVFALETAPPGKIVRFNIETSPEESILSIDAHQGFAAFENNSEVKWFVERHDGVFTHLKNRTGGGGVFRVTLPIDNDNLEEHNQ